MVILIVIETNLRNYLHISLILFNECHLETVFAGQSDLQFFCFILKLHCLVIIFPIYQKLTFPSSAPQGSGNIDIIILHYIFSRLPNPCMTGNFLLLYRIFPKSRSYSRYYLTYLNFITILPYGSKYYSL